MISDLEGKRIFIVYHCNDTSDREVVFNCWDVSYVLLNTAEHFISTAAHPWTPNVYIVDSKDIGEYIATLKFLYLTQYWNPRAIFIISLSQNEDIGEYAEISWKHGIQPLYIITPEGKMFTYFLFKDGSCGNNTKLQEISRETKIEVFNREPQLYFNNCPLKILAFTILPYVIDPFDKTNCGYEVKLIKAIAARARLIPVFLNHSYPHWGQTKKNGSYSYMFQDLYEGKADMVMGMVVAQSNWFSKDFDGTHIPGLEASHFFVPSALPIDGWKNFTLVFSKTVWAVLTVAVVFTSLAVYVVTKTSDKTAACTNLPKCIFITLRMSLSPQSVPAASGYLRFTLTLWCSSFLLINSAYQSQLISTLMKPSHDHQITTVDEAIHSSQLQYGGFEGLIEFFNAAAEDIYKDVKKNWINCSLTEKCLNRTAKKRDFAVMKTVKTVKYYTRNMYRRPNGEFEIYKLNDYAFVYSISFALRRGSPYLERFNSLIAALVENGLYDKWIDSIPNPIRRRHADQLVQLNLHHLKAAFLLLIAGELCAVVAFIIEIKCRLRRVNDKLL